MLTEEGRVFEWGTHEHLSGLQGGKKAMQRTEPESVFGDLKDQVIVQLASGTSHRLALTSTGEVYAWGENGCGELGIGPHGSKTEPMKLHGFSSRIRSVACGECTSYAVDTSGNVILAIEFIV